jgi:tetratricopeptide (TPR) repeat protein
VAPGTFLLDYLQEQVSDNLDLAEFGIVEQKARRMIAADPSRPEGHFALGVTLLHLERHQDALDAFAVADVCDPDHAPTLYNIAYTHEKMGAYTQAAQWYERTLQHDKKHLAALHHLGRVYQQMAQRDKAISLWRQALRLQPGYFPAQNSLFEAGEGPKPAEPPLPANYYERERMTPVVKQRMRSPQVFRNGGLTLTFDPQVGYILEDADNQRNGTIHAGGPFKVGTVTLDEDILDLMGLIKLLVRMVNTENTRDIAILIYYANGDMFNYVAQFARGKRTQFDVDGRFIVTEVPRLFKLRMNSDLSTPYGDPMQGLLIYLNQGTEPGRLVSTLGLGVAL